MTIDVGVGGVFKAVPDMWVGVTSAWKKVSDGWVGVGGVWKQFYTSVAVNLLGLDPYGVAITPDDSTAVYTLTSSGLEAATGLSDSTWLLSGVASDYDVRVTVTAGTLTSGTAGAWLNLGTNRSWSKVNPSNISSVQTVSMTVEISLAGAGVPIASAAVVITAEVIE